MKHAKSLTIHRVCPCCCNFFCEILDDFHACQECFPKKTFGVSCGKNMLDDCLFPRRTRSALEYVETGNEMSAQPTCCHTVTFATRSLLRRSVVPAKFLFGRVHVACRT